MYRRTSAIKRIDTLLRFNMMKNERKHIYVLKRILTANPVDAEEALYTLLS